MLHWEDNTESLNHQTLVKTGKWLMIASQTIIDFLQDNTDNCYREDHNHNDEFDIYGRRADAICWTIRKFLPWAEL